MKKVITILATGLAMMAQDTAPTVPTAHQTEHFAAMAAMRAARARLEASKKVLAADCGTLAPSINAGTQTITCVQLAAPRGRAK